MDDRRHESRLALSSQPSKLRRLQWPRDLVARDDDA
jgi:hypothetical protein